jgi:hypothetical protein
MIRLNVDSGQWSVDSAKPQAVSSGIPLSTFRIKHLLFIIFILLAAPVFAQSDRAPEIVGVRVGLADRFKVGLWTPVEITLSGGSQAQQGVVAVTVPDGDGIPSRVTSPADRPCRVLPGRQTKVMLDVRIGRVSSELKVEFIVDGRVAVAKTMTSSLAADKDHFLEPLEMQPLFVTFGPTKLGIAENPRLRQRDPENRPVEALLDDVEDLPTHWYGYEGLNALIFSTSRPELYRSLMVRGERMEALDQWIRLGGRLLLCVGSQAEEVLAENSPLRRFVPGRLEQTVPFPRTAALEIYSDSSTAVPQARRGEGLLPRAPKLEDVQGVVEAREADLPLIIRTPRGLGQIIFLAVDLDREPLSNWPDRNMLLAKLLDLPTGTGEKSSAGAALSHYSYTDLSGQLRSALDLFTGVYLIPFWVVALIIIVYILLIGPGDYFFLRKVLGRMRWTWLTFPVIVAAISGGAYLLACGLKGDQLRINQVDLLDVDAASGLVRGTTWLNVFSPRTQSFNLSLQPLLPDGRAAADAQFYFAWFGLEGRALGGMNSRGVNPMLWPEPYNFSPPLNALQDVPIQVWSTKSFTGRWASSTATFPSADLSADEQSLSGTITNTLAFPLRQCILVHDRWAYELGDLAPGQTAIVDQYLQRSELKTLLTGKKMIFDEKYRQEITPYDQSSTDVAYILKMMMFYNAVDGSSYTRLGNGYQSFVDLSDLLKTPRAMLIAEGSENPRDKYHGAVPLCGNKPLTEPTNKHKTIYRFVFSVKSAQ